MFDHKLELRKNNFHKTDMDILEARESHKLTLRKQNIESIITHRRERFAFSLDDKNCELEINPESLIIPQDYIRREYDNDYDFYFAIKKLLINEEKDLNLVKLGIYLLRKSLSKAKNPPVEYLQKEGIINLMCRLIHNHIKDPKLIVNKKFNPLNSFLV